MKKQFFYAAFALAMMASCTNDDNLVVDPITPSEDDKVAIELGIDAPTVNASVNGRAVGSVGDVATGENKWNGQQLYIAMIDKETKALEFVKNANGTDTETPLLGHETYTYYAPNASENNGSGNIRIYQNNSTTMLQHVYYPVAGTYDFLGWHIDDATDGTDNGKPTVTIDANNKTVKGIVITGQQDIMGARTKEFTADNYQPASNATLNFNELIGWDFSARTARNGIQPKLKFEHQLARLKFFVKAGSESAAEYVYTPGEGENAGTWAKKANRTHTPTSGTTSITTTEAMYVKAIKAIDMANKLNMDLASSGADGLLHVKTTADNPTENKDDFDLLSRGTDGKMKATLDLVAPAIYVNDVQNLTTGDEVTDVDLNNFEKGTPVGESIMFLPVEGSTEDAVKLSITLQQLVKDTENEDVTDENSKYTYTLKEQTADLTVLAKSVKTAEGASAEKFEAGKSYNVYITIYGFERIEVSAELTAWEMGGDVDVDVEEGVSKHTTDLTFNVVDANNSTALNNASIKVYDLNGVEINAQTDNANKFSVLSHTTVRYEISADGYETISSYVNTETSKTVSIKLRQGQATTISSATADATITVTEKGTANVVPANNGSYSLAIGATYMIKVEKEGHVTKTVEHKVLSGANTVSIEALVEEEEEEPVAPTTKDVTFVVTPEEATISITKVVGEGGGDPVDPQEGTKKYTLEIGSTYSISISCEGYTTHTESLQVSESTEETKTISLTEVNN